MNDAIDEILHSTAISRINKVHFLYSIPKESSAHDLNVKTFKTVKYMYS